MRPSLSMSNTSTASKATRAPDASAPAKRISTTTVRPRR